MAAVAIVSFIGTLIFPAPTANASNGSDTPQPPETTFTSGHPEYDAAYAKATRDIANDVVDGKFIAGQNWAQVWTRDTSYSVDLGAAVVQPAAALKTMRGMTQMDPTFGEVWIQDTSGHFQGWPNLTDSIVGAVGAWATYNNTGDKDFLRWSYQVTKNSLARSESVVFDRKSGLFKGCSTFMESDSGYPKAYAHNGSAVGRTKALSTNILYYRAYVLAAKMGKLLRENVAGLHGKAEKLRRTINDRLWLPDKGYYAYYEDADGNKSDRMEGTGESFAVLWGVASRQRAASILAKTPTTAQGIPSLWPQYPEWKDYSRPDEYYYHNGMVWPFVQGYWAWAASSKGDTRLLGTELAKLVALSQKETTFHEFYRPEDGKPDGSPRQLWSASGYLSMIYHGLFGMDAEPDGLHFAPVVPETFHDLTLTGIPYRGMTLDIQLTGSGTEVAKFAVDGVTRLDKSVPANLTGKHTVAITMF